MVKGRQNGVAREEELASAFLYACEVDIGPALEQAPDVLDRAPPLDVNILVQEPLTFAGEWHHHVVDYSLGNVIRFSRQIERPFSMRFEVEIALICRCALSETT